MTLKAAETPVDISPYLKTDWTFVALFVTPFAAAVLFVVAAALH